MTNTVRHIGYGILLNLSLDDLGHPDRPGLWEEIYHPHPFTEVLRCPEPVGAGFCPEVMYVQVREGQQVAVHRNKDVANHARSAESDLHQALKDRVAESAVAAGLSVEVESSASDRARVTDVLVSGHTGRKIGWEIQISGIAPRKVLGRSSVADRDRITPLWTVTRVNAAPINRAPWARLPVMDDWRMARARHLAVQGGVRKLVMRPCELPWFTKCPTGARALCGKKHPTLTPLEVELDDLILWSAEATYLPLFHRTSKTAGHYMWVSAGDKAEYLQGQPEELPYANLSIATASDGAGVQAPKPEDPTCRYGERAQAGRARPPRESGDDLPAPILARPHAQRSLDWSGNQIGDPRPCRICGGPAIMRDTQNKPCHKVCAEAES